MAQVKLSMQLTQQSYAELVSPTVKLSPGTLVKAIRYMYWPAKEPNSEERGSPAMLLDPHASQKVAVATAATAVVVENTVVVSAAADVVSVMVEVVL